MPLPRYQPVKKKAKVAIWWSFEELDDGCISRIIGHALDQAKARDEEPFVGDNGKTEMNLSLVSRRWYFLTQTQVSDRGVHQIDLDEALRRASQMRQQPPPAAAAAAAANKFSSSMGMTSALLRTPGRLNGMQPTRGAHSTRALSTVGTSARKRLPPYGILSQRNMSVTNGADQQQATTGKSSTNGTGTAPSYDIRLFRVLQPKLLKYKHLQLSGSISVENFDKLLVALNAARIERLDLLKLRIEGVRPSSIAKASQAAAHTLAHLQTLTFTWTNNANDDASNGLLWTIYERAVNLRQLQVYLIDDYSLPINSSNGSNGSSGSNGNDSQRSNESARSAPASQSAICDFNGKLAAPLMARAHPHLLELVFDRLVPPNMEPSQYIAPINCDYSILMKRLLAQEASVSSLSTNDSSLIHYLIHSSGRLCTKHELRRLRLTHPLKSLDTLQRLVSLANLGANYLSIAIENADQLAEVRAALEQFSAARKHQARCQLNLFIKDQKFPDADEKVKHLINLCRLVDVNVFIGALQRISIDCCHLMWSIGRSLQALANETPGRCIFKISLQTYPIKPNTVNPCEITIPFGRCHQFKISSSREDIVRHREIMKALKRDCYHQFVKSVRDNNVP